MGKGIREKYVSRFCLCEALKQEKATPCRRDTMELRITNNQEKTSEVSIPVFRQFSLIHIFLLYKTSEVFQPDNYIDFMRF
ncbi:MAG: hypothetical protein DWQ02_21935 [Bacteroidetes bacterium]|nr:MAG: hypothetical protein DWQ02_21935 [Bacteroidota bacterium]